MSFSLRTGLFRGTVLDPATRKSVAFNGVMLQDRAEGRGWFIGTHQGGRGFVAP